VGGEFCAMVGVAAALGNVWVPAVGGAIEFAAAAGMAGEGDSPLKSGVAANALAAAASSAAAVLIDAAGARVRPPAAEGSLEATGPATDADAVEVWEAPPPGCVLPVAAGTVLCGG
jgi:hypothetical protein